ncbi:MAG: TetR/AcrR family transcriptional regulator [Bacteroidetes bacterium]|nr:TetR/AcrR family transcriptional regulator [Bacteroidota bacterium]
MIIIKTTKVNIADRKKGIILDVTKKLIVQYGYAKTTLDDIAGALGIKKSSLYYYYKNKEDIIYEVMMREKSLYLKCIKEALEIEGSTLYKVLSYERAKENYLKESISPFDLTVSQFIEIKKSIKDIFKNIECDEKQILAEVISNGIKKNELKKCSKDRVAETIINISEAIRLKEFHNSETQRMKESDFDKVRKQIEEIINLIFDGIKKQ